MLSGGIGWVDRKVPHTQVQAYWEAISQANPDSYDLDELETTRFNLGPTTTPKLNAMYRLSEYLVAEDIAGHLGVDVSTVVQIAIIAGMFQLEVVPDEYNRRLWKLLSEFLRWAKHRAQVGEDALRRALSTEGPNGQERPKTKADLELL